jgi:hypothetical protein
VAALGARAQQQAATTIGFLHDGSPESYAGTGLIAGFRQGLMEAGFFEGRNLTIEYRWARFDPLSVGLCLEHHFEDRRAPAGGAGVRKPARRDL